jgi:hypothetical protein
MRFILNRVLLAFILDCASASKGDPTPSMYQRLDFPKRIPVSVGSQSAPMGTPPMMLIFLDLSECQIVFRWGSISVLSHMPMPPNRLSHNLGIAAMAKRILTAALETGDLPAALAALDQDVVFHSPILATTSNEVRGHPM